ARDRWRAANSQAESAGDRDHRPAPQRTALCVASEYHEGEEKADRGQDTGGLCRRCRAPPRYSKNHRAPGSKIRSQGRLGRRAGRQAQGRGGSSAMTTLLVAEHDNATLKDATHKALKASGPLGGEVHVLVAGLNCRPVAEAAAKLQGVGKVLLADAPPY